MSAPAPGLSELERSARPSTYRIVPGGGRITRRLVFGTCWSGRPPGATGAETTVVSIDDLLVGLDFTFLSALAGQHGAGKEGLAAIQLH